jgi:hypothetical protein
MLSNKLQIYTLTGVLESGSDCVGDSDVTLRHDFVACLTAIVSVAALWVHFLFAFRAASEIHLPLIVIYDALNITG